VGYLDDGTMIVIEDALAAIDQDVRVDVVSALQTSAGRLVFARLADGEAVDAGGAAGASSAARPAESTMQPGAAGSPDGSGLPGSESRQAAAPETPPVRLKGPFPPKPPASARPPSARNPRR
jgi:hypothetical protein